MSKSAILLIYTGGTIGMKDSGHGLVPFDFSQILTEVPELQKFTLKLDSYTFDRQARALLQREARMRD